MASLDTDSATMVCYKARMATSAGVFLGDMPLKTNVPLLLAQISVIFFCTRAVHAVLRPLAVPEVISHTLAGVILGPTFLSRSTAFRDILFPISSWIHLNMVALLAFLLSIFVVGVKTDLTVIQKSGKKAIAIAYVGFFLSLASVIAFGIIHNNSLPPPFAGNAYFIYRIPGRWSFTAYAVLAILLGEFNLLTSKLGRLAMSAALLSDFTGIIVQVGGRAWGQSIAMGTALVGLAGILTFAGFLVAILFMARPMVLWMLRRMPKGGPMDEVYFLTVLMLAVGFGLAGELIGQHAMLGPLLFGMVLPGGPPLGTTLSERLDRVVAGLFLPIYMAIAGFRVNVWMMATQGGVAATYMALFIVIAVTTKFVGVILPCLYYRMPFRDSLVVALMMSCKGIIEIQNFWNWDEAHVLNTELYSVNVVMLLVVGSMTAALMKRMYKPSMRFLAYKRRTIEQSRRGGELRLMVCVHNDDNVPPSLGLLELSHPCHDSPICAYLLHLTPLEGRTAPVLLPYKGPRHPRKGSFNSASTDHIVNAFRALERHNTGRLFVLPFVGIAPYSTMHDYICSIALDKKVALVILPFHKHLELGGAVHSATSAVRAMNANVFAYTPCSVAILVDHGFTTTSITSPGHRVALFFLGGADDREALAYASRMADSPLVELSVVRFRTPEDVEDESDREAVEEFCSSTGGNGRVEYREEVVRDGAGMVTVIRNMCKGGYGLLIVGRRQGVESAMTLGMDMWSEYPELGVIGDVLASTDFAGKVSTLVVQQQRAISGAGADDTPSRRSHVAVEPNCDGSHARKEAGDEFESSRVPKGEEEKWVNWSRTI